MHLELNDFIETFPSIVIGSIFLFLTCWLGYEYVTAKNA
jgi:hypothetical protein